MNALNISPLKCFKTKSSLASYSLTVNELLTGTYLFIHWFFLLYIDFLNLYLYFYFLFFNSIDLLTALF